MAFKTPAGCMQKSKCGASLTMCTWPYIDVTWTMSTAAPSHQMSVRVWNDGMVLPFKALKRQPHVQIACAPWSGCGLLTSLALRLLSPLLAAQLQPCFHANLVLNLRPFLPSIPPARHTGATRPPTHTHTRRVERLPLAQTEELQVVLGFHLTRQASSVNGGSNSPGRQRRQQRRSRQRNRHMLLVRDNTRCRT